MKTIFRLFKTKKGVSLVEVMIVLGIVSTTLVASVSIIAKSLIEVRVNEIEDSVNTALIQTMEIVKSPQDIAVTGDPRLTSYGSANYFKLNTNGNSNVLVYDAANQTEISNCDANSYYGSEYLITSGIESFNLCLQVIVTPINNNGSIYYNIEAKAIFDLPSGEEVNSYKGLRFSTFSNQ